MIELEVGVPLARLQHGDVLEAIAEAKSTVVMKIIAEEHVSGRSLRRRRLQRLLARQPGRA